MLGGGGKAKSKQNINIHSVGSRRRSHSIVHTGNRLVLSVFNSVHALSLRGKNVKKTDPSQTGFHLLLHSLNSWLVTGRWSSYKTSEVKGHLLLCKNILYVKSSTTYDF